MKKSKLRSIIRELIKEQLGGQSLTLGDTPTYKQPRECSSNIWQYVVSKGWKEAYCGLRPEFIGQGTRGGCRGDDPFQFPVSTEIDPSGRIGREYCACCEYELVPKDPIKR